MESLVLGLDVGGTYIKAALIDNSGKVIDEREVPSHARDGSAQDVRVIVDQIFEHYRAQNQYPKAIGVGCAGSVNPHTGVVVNSPNFREWKNIPLRDWLSKDFGLPVHLENDANCAVMAEWKLGAGRGSRNVVLLTLGTGIGGGLVLDNKIFNGSTGTAGEIGHLSIESHGVPCPCGNRGCFERYCSSSALESKCPGFSVPEIFAKAAKGDEPFRGVLEDFLSRMEIALVSLSNLFDPDTIILAGGIAQGLRPYLDRLTQTIRKRAFPMVAERVALKEAKMGSYAGAIGAALFGAQARVHSDALAKASSLPTQLN